MTVVQYSEGNLVFSLRRGGEVRNLRAGVERFDEWSFYRRTFAAQCNRIADSYWRVFDDNFSGVDVGARKAMRRMVGGTKAVDFVVVAPDEGAGARGDTTWLVEVKDYRWAAEGDAIFDLSDEIARKVVDTLACLAAARFNAADDERTMARLALQSERLRVVLHLEQPVGIPAFNVDAVKTDLRKRLGAVDANLLVVNAALTPLDVPWTVTDRFLA